MNAHEKALEAVTRALFEKAIPSYAAGEHIARVAITAYLETLLADKALVEEMAKAIYLLQPETISRRRIEGTALHEDSLVIPFEEACNKDNAMQKAQAALDVIRRKVG